MSEFLQPSPPRTEGFAIASLVASLLGFVGGGPLGWIPGIICGHIARSRIKRDPSLGGRGMATAGLIIGYSGLALILLAIATLFTILIFFPPDYR